MQKFPRRNLREKTLEAYADIGRNMGQDGYVKGSLVIGATKGLIYSCVGTAITNDPLFFGLPPVVSGLRGLEAEYGKAKQKYIEKLK